MSDGSPDLEHLAKQVREERDEIGAILDELDLRRRELLDWRLQLRRHRTLVVTIVVLAGTSIGLAIWRRHRRQTPLGRVQRLRNALARVIRGNDDAELGAQAAGSAANQASASATKQLVKRMFGFA